MEKRRFPFSITCCVLKKYSAVFDLESASPIKSSEVEIFYGLIIK